METMDKGMEIAPELIVRCEDSLAWLLMAQHVVAFDLQTTERSPHHGGRIIEIGAVRMVNGQIVEEFVEKVNPEQSLSKKVKAERGIDASYEEAFSFHEVLPRFLDWMGTAVIAAHHLPFHARFLAHFLQKCGRQLLNPGIDTLALAKKAFPLFPRHNLNELCVELGIPLPANTALHKARTIGNLLPLLKQYFEADFKARRKTFPVPFVQPVLPSVEPVVVKKIRTWESVTKKKTQVRQYVETDRGQVFYDVIAERWENDTIAATISFLDIERQVLARLGFTQREELRTYRSAQRTRKTSSV